MQVLKSDNLHETAGDNDRPAFRPNTPGR